MSVSVNTNAGALVAVQSLNRTGRELGRLEATVSTGLRVRGAVDDASSFSIAQDVRSEIKGLAAVSQSLANAKGVSTVAIAGATAFSDMMGELKGKIVQGANAANTPAQQAILQDDYVAILGRMRQALEQASFNGENILIELAIPFNLAVGVVNDLDVIANTDGSTLRLHGQRIDVAWAQMSAQDISTTANAQAALTQWETSMALVGDALGALGADARALDHQQDFISVLTDAQATGLGSIVDADMARSATRLQAVQVKQQLGVQTLGIANQRPRTLLGLFRGG